MNNPSRGFYTMAPVGVFLFAISPHFYFFNFRVQLLYFLFFIIPVKPMILTKEVNIHEIFIFQNFFFQICETQQFNKTHISAPLFSTKHPLPSQFIFFFFGQENNTINTALLKKKLSQ